MMLPLHLSSQGVGLGFNVRGAEGLGKCGLREAGAAGLALPMPPVVLTLAVAMLVGGP